MPALLDDIVYNEPSGRPITLVHFGTAVVYASMGLYTRIAGETGLSSWLLVMAVGTALAGIAESLPKHRRQTAGVVRAVAILVLVCLVAVSVARPEFVVG